MPNKPEFTIEDLRELKKQLDSTNISKREFYIPAAHPNFLRLFDKIMKQEVKKNNCK